jgi:hypothetical protein
MARAGRSACIVSVALTAAGAGREAATTDKAIIKVTARHPVIKSFEPGEGIRREPAKLEDVKTYVRNLALWLAPPDPEK